MKKFQITYLSGQSVIMLGNSLDEVAQSAERTIAWLKAGRPHIGIASVIEVA